jgi:hypothetical protein
MVVNSVSRGDRRMSSGEIVEVSVDETRKVPRGPCRRRIDVVRAETERAGHDEKEAGHWC